MAGIDVFDVMHAAASAGRVPARRAAGAWHAIPRPSAVMAVALALMLSGCRSADAPRAAAARYVVTATPIDLGVGARGFCVAIDRRDPKGVWWWQPGEDCSTRSTGPAVFPAEHASLSPFSPAGALDVRFRIQLIRARESSKPPFQDILLVLEEGQLRAPATGSRVRTVTRRDLDIPGWQSR